MVRRLCYGSSSLFYSSLSSPTIKQPYSSLISSSSPWSSRDCATVSSKPRPSFVELHQSPRGRAVSSSPSGLSLTPHREALIYKSSPPRRDRISRPWYPPPSPWSSSSRNGEVEKQKWWIWDVLHIWSLFFWIITNWPQNYWICRKIHPNQLQNFQLCILDPVKCNFACNYNLTPKCNLKWSY